MNGEIQPLLTDKLGEEFQKYFIQLREFRQISNRFKGKIEYILNKNKNGKIVTFQHGGFGYIGI